MELLIINVYEDQKWINIPMHPSTGSRGEKGWSSDMVLTRSFSAANRAVIVLVFVNLYVSLFSVRTPSLYLYLVLLLVTSIVSLLAPKHSISRSFFVSCNFVIPTCFCSRTPPPYFVIILSAWYMLVYTSSLFRPCYFNVFRFSHTLC